MYLYLTGKYRNCLYVNDEDQAVYAVETPSGIFSTVSTIKRAIDNGQAAQMSSGGDRHALSGHRFTNIAQIEFNTFSPSLIRFDGGSEYETRGFFQNIGLRNNLGFTGTDGLEYKWRLSDNALHLVRRNTAKTLIARFRKGSIGFFSNPRPASLEILPDGMHMVDLIVITYVFAQKEYDSRRSRRRRRRHAGGF